MSDIRTVSAMHAIKAVYNRGSRLYDVQVRLQAEPLLAHEGWLVFDNVARAADGIRRGVLVPNIKPAARAALLAWLALAS